MGGQALESRAANEAAADAMAGGAWTAGGAGTAGGAATASGAAMLRELVERIDSSLVAAAAEHSTGATPDSTPLAGPRAAKVESIEGEGVLHVLFELGGSAFAVPAALLAEVEAYEPPMPIPGVPDWLLGIESFRGEVLSITDLAALLGFSKLVPSAHARTLVVSDPRSRRPLTGLAVDAVITHQWLPATEGGEAAAEALGGRLGRFARRIIELDGRALAELELEALLASEEFLALHD